jgi:hypothetical protein
MQKLSSLLLVKYLRNYSMCMIWHLIEDCHKDFLQWDAIIVLH